MGVTSGAGGVAIMKGANARVRVADAGPALEFRLAVEAIQARNREIRQASEGVADLANNTSVPILIVDNDLRISRATRAAEHPFNVTEADIGRPISRIRSRLGSVDLASLARSVIEAQTVEEVDLPDSDTPWQRLRVRPCIAGRLRVAGAVLTLTGIDPLHGHKVAESIVESVPIPLLILNGQLHVRFVSREFLAAWGLRMDDVQNRHVNELEVYPFTLPEFKCAMRQLSMGKTESLEIECMQGDLAALIQARRLDGEPNGQLVIAIRDITEQTHAHRVLTHALHDSQDALRLSREELRALAGRLLHSQDEERRRVSRELHDDLSQNVAALQLQIEALVDRLPSRMAEEKRSLAAISDGVVQLSHDLRRIAYGLHPSTLDVLGFTAALSAYAGEFAQRTGIHVKFGATDVPEEIPSAIAGSLYRIAQEALRNIARHAAAGVASISIKGENSLLTLAICDNGQGFERETVRGRGGLGLVSMEERARLIRAGFQLDTSPGRGVSITVSAPLA